MNLDFRQQILTNWRFLTGVGAALLLIFGLAYFFYGLQPSLAARDSVTFTVTRGESFRSIGARLSQAQLVRSIAVFKLYALASGKAHKFQPGVYELSFDMSVPDLVRIFTAGAKDITATIPEGATLKDADALLASAKVIEAGDILRFNFHVLDDEFPFLSGVNNLEGFLFPDTYRFDFDADPERVIRSFLANFHETVWPILESDPSWYDTLILASLLEKEVPEFKDRRIVAGILQKRMALKMPLQVDATITYAVCNGTFITCENIKAFRDDLRVASPFNTYRRLGFPPTPIANPGLDAVKAASAPEATSYLYYLSAALTGETIFSKTLNEHNANKAKYL